MFKYPIYVTLDTNIFVANKYDFSENSTLSLLTKYVAEGKIKVVLSNIVYREVSKHITDECDTVCGSLRKLRAEIQKTVSEEFLKQVGLDVPLKILDKKVYREKSENIWKKFVEKLKPEYLTNEAINLDSIIDDYFSFKPPFENSEKKRKEFPDAFIASQIRARFVTGETVAIISDDNGFKRACGNAKNYIYFNTLGELYDTLNRQEQEYQTIVDNANNLIRKYYPEIKNYLMHADCVEVHGLSCDKDGIVEGFDYSDIDVSNVNGISCYVRTVDEITDNVARITMVCNANIDAVCYYEDYDNAAWDHETESYIYLETRANLEKHVARFGIRIEVNRTTEEIKMLPYKVILNGDTLIEWFELDESEEYEDDYLNQEREEVGLRSLDSYDEYLDEELPNSDFYKKIMSLFERINRAKDIFEESASSFDELISFFEEIKDEDKQKAVIRDLAKIEQCPIDEFDEDKIEEIIKNVITWCGQEFERLSDVCTNIEIPESISYGTTVHLLWNDVEYELSIDELKYRVEPGEEEIIDIHWYAGDEVFDGYVKLIVSFLELNEDGGIGNGIEDDISYYCNKICEGVEELVTLIEEQSEIDSSISDLINSII